jgi:WD40-like Beta Propeller Repeat
VRRLTFNSATDRMPRFSPDGRRIAFASDREDRNFEIYVMDLGSGTTRRVTDDPVRDDVPVFTADGGHLVWQRGPSLCPCSIWTSELDGTGARQADTGPGDALFPDMSPHGETLTFTSVRGGVSAINVQQLDGQARRQVTTPPAGVGDFRSRWSPRGRDLVFMRDDGSNQNDVYTVHQDGTELTQLTSGPRFEEHPQFSPDGEKVIFSVFPPDGSARMHTIRRDGTGEHALPRLAEIADSFDGPGLDSALWWQFVTGTGGAVEQTGGRVELTLAPDAADDPAAGFMGPSIGTLCSMVGDYDAQYDFELIEWPSSNGVHLLLGDAGETGSIARRSDDGFEDYFAFFNPVLAFAATDDLRGTMRLVRVGTTLTAYYRTSYGWTPLLSGPSGSTPARVNAHLFSNDELFGDRRVRVAMDNFRVRADTFDCPSWWRDAGPDWQPVSA